MQLKAGKEVKRNKEHLRQTEHKKQAGRLNPTISIITLNANGLNKPLKGRDCQIENHLYVIYKKYALNVDLNMLKI